jgi:hypothetical protein
MSWIYANGIVSYVQAPALSTRSSRGNLEVLLWRKTPDVAILAMAVLVERFNHKYRNFLR